MISHTMTVGDNVYQQEWDKDTEHHRIVRNNSARTKWASYTQIAHMDGIVSTTAYFVQKECLMTSDAFCQQIAVS